MPLASTDVNAVVSATAPPAPNTFKTIGDAFASAPADTTPFVIYIKNDTYHERHIKHENFAIANLTNLDGLIIASIFS
ncbi:MAG: hypothetical protein ACSLEN_06760 [Candidatus Malihini olakiniferum]